jgi:hypothetical protein
LVLGTRVGNLKHSGNMNRGKQSNKRTYCSENQINKSSRQLFLPHKHFTEHLVGVTENPQQEYDENSENSSL